MNALPQEEFCPRCGQWVTILDDYSGWCTPCAKHTRRVFVAHGADTRHCGKCDEVKPVTEFAASSYYCRSCGAELKRMWRLRNADREAAYQASRRSGRCRECLEVACLTKSGVMSNHVYRMRRVFGGERCAGSGQPPQEAAT